MLPPVPTTVSVPLVIPVVQIKSAEKDVTPVCTTTSVERRSSAVMTNASVTGPYVHVRPTSIVTLASSAIHIIRTLLYIYFVLLFLFVRLPVWCWRGLLWGSLLVDVWLERRVYCRRNYRYNYLLCHHHFYCILLLLCLFPVLPLSYSHCCSRHPTAATTVRLNSHDDDAASTSSSAA